jgi:hypothetical protein
VLLTAAAPGWAQTAQDAIKGVPETALGFFVVNNLGEISSKIENAAKRAGHNLPGTLLDHLKSEAGIDKGLNTSGSALVVLMGQDGGQPAPVIYMPVTDYSTFVSGLKGKTDGKFTEFQSAKGKTIVVASKGSFAVLAETQYRDALEAALKAPAAGTVLNSVQTWVSDHDISGVMMPKTVQMLAAMGRQGLGMAKQFGAAVPPEAQFVMGWIDGLDDFLKSIGTDVSNLAGGARLDPAGNLSLGLLAVFARDSGFARGAAEARAPQIAPLSGLPDIPYVTALGGAFSEKATSGLMTMSIQIIAAIAKDAPPEKLKAMEQVLVDMGKQIRGMSMLLGTGKGQEALFQGMYGILRVEDSQAYLRANMKYVDLYNTVVKDIKLPGGAAVPTGNMSAKELTVAGLPAVELVTEFQFAGPQAEMQKQLMELYYGPGAKMKVTMVAVDRQTLLMRYSDTAAAKEFIDEYKTKSDRLARDANVTKVVALLPEGGQFIALVSPTGLVEVFNRFAAMIPQAGGFQAPAFPAVPPLAIGTRLSGSGLEARVVVPAATLEGIGKYAQGLR